MSWRNNAQRTGMNAQPLGNTRRWGGGSSSSSGDQGGPPSYSQNPRDAAAAIAASIGIKRDRDDLSSSGRSDRADDGGESFASFHTQFSGSLTTDPIQSLAAPRKRRSRWGDAADQVNIPTALGAGVPSASLTAMQSRSAWMRLRASSVLATLSHRTASVPRPHHPRTTIRVVVPTPARSATARNSRMSACPWWRSR